MSLFSSSPSSSIGVLKLSPMVSCKYLHLSQPGAGRTSQRTAMPGSCLQAHLGASRSGRVGVCPWNGSQVGAVSRWPFLQFLHHFVCPCISLRQEQFWFKTFEIGGWPHRSTGGHIYLLGVIYSGSISMLLSILASATPIGS